MKNREPGNRHQKQRALIGAAVVIIVLGLIAGFCVWWGNQSSSEAVTAELRTATVERTSLVAGFRLSGMLGYGDAVPLGGGDGIVTRAPSAGDIVSTGQVIMEIEGVPVFLLQGGLPLWREIGPTTSGPDVAMVRQALHTLGFGVGGPGQTYDQELSDAIAAMYAAAGYEVVPPTTQQQQARDLAESALDAANQNLMEAQAALEVAAQRKPSQSSVVAARIALSEAQRNLEAVRAGDCPSVRAAADTNTPSRSPSIPAQCTSAEIAAAQEALTLAEAQRSDAEAAPDTSAEQLTVDRAWRAVCEAQEARDVAFHHVVSPQSVLVVPEPTIRIDNVLAKTGMPASGAVLTWTRTVLSGHADLTDAQHRLLTTGMQATMTLVDGTEVDGIVEELTDAAIDSMTMQAVPASARITITDQTKVEDLSASAITITFVQDEVEAALVVPVTALMALAEGGYCVQRPDGTLVAVTVGLVADTRAQVTSDELHEGDEVVIP